MRTDKTTTPDQPFELPGYYNKHYIEVDDQGCITRGWSDGPHPEKDATDAICINEQGGYQFRLLVTCEEQNSDGTGLNIRTETTEENPPLWTMDGIPLYKWEDGRVIPRTEEEIAADRAAIPEPPPNAQEQLRADVDFLAAMQGVSL